MKKIFTLLFALGTFTLVQAQPGTRDNRQSDHRDMPQVDQRNGGYDNRDVVVYDRNDNNYGRSDNNGRYDDRFAPVERRRDIEIARVNREYDYKIMKVKNSFFISRWEKEKQIRYLQAQRQQEIRMVYIKFSQRRDRDFDRDDHHRRY
jgi:hypothetical protein